MTTVAELRAEVSAAEELREACNRALMRTDIELPPEWLAVFHDLNELTDAGQELLERVELVVERAPHAVSDQRMRDALGDVLERVRDARLLMERLVRRGDGDEEDA